MPVRVIIRQHISVLVRFCLTNLEVIVSKVAFEGMRHDDGPNAGPKYDGLWRHLCESSTEVLTTLSERC